MDKLFSFGKIPTIVLMLVLAAALWQETSKSTTYEKQYRELKEEHFKSIFTSKTRTTHLELTVESLESQLHTTKTVVSEEKHTTSILRIENSKLKESSKSRWFKLIKPDGTIVEKRYTEENREEISSTVTSIQDEYERKVSSIENKWMTIHKTLLRNAQSRHVAQTATLVEKHSKELLEEKIKKSSTAKSIQYHIRGGYNSDLSYYGGFGYHILGPLYIDSSLSFTPTSLDSGQLGLGIGF